MSRFVEIDNRIINLDNITCAFDWGHTHTKIFFTSDKDDCLIVDLTYEEFKLIVLDGKK